MRGADAAAGFPSVFAGGYDSANRGIPPSVRKCRQRGIDHGTIRHQHRPPAGQRRQSGISCLQAPGGFTVGELIAWRRGESGICPSFEKADEKESRGVISTGWSWLFAGASLQTRNVAERRAVIPEDSRAVAARESAAEISAREFAPCHPTADDADRTAASAAGGCISEAQARWSACRHRRLHYTIIAMQWRRRPTSSASPAAGRRGHGGFHLEAARKLNMNLEHITALRDQGEEQPGKRWNAAWTSPEAHRLNGRGENPGAELRDVSRAARAAAQGDRMGRDATPVTD